jgi:hypothetical protein
MLICTFCEEVMTQFTPLFAGKERPSGRFPEAIRCRDLPSEWRRPLQGTECGAGTESDDATATVPRESRKLRVSILSDKKI